MDRFKFRVWKQDNWGYNIKNEFVKQKPHYEYFELNNNNIVFHKNDIIEQCTGLKDKNGNLIYEGDILKDNQGRIAKVYWSVTWCEFDVVYTYNNTDTVYSFTDWTYEKRCRTEIIGNIHENKDLLEDKKNE